VRNREEIIKITKGYESLPTLPQFLLRLQEACNREDAAYDDLCKIISVDPSLCARTLTTAHFAALLGKGERITSLSKAVAFLGLDAVKNLASTALVLQAFSQLRWNSLINLTRFWEKSFLCGCFARRIAQRISYPRPEEAWLAGLLHDIGKLLLLVNLGGRYSAILNDSQGTRDLLQRERDKTGVTHCEVAAWLIRQWDARSLMADAVLYQHEPQERIMDAFPLVKIVHVANRLCFTPSENLGAAVEGAKDVLGLDPSQVAEIGDAAKQEVADVARDFDIPIEECAAHGPSMAEDKGGRLKDLLYEVRDTSLLTGTLQNLLKADSTHTILGIIGRSLQILFHVEKVFFFSYVPARDVLVGISSEKDGEGDPIEGLEIALANEKSLIARSLTEKMFLDSFGDPGPGTMTIAEEEIIHQAGTEGILCIPMLIGDQKIGVLVAGTSQSQFRRLTRQAKLLNMFANQAAISLRVEEMKQNRARLLQSERWDAAATIARKIGHEVNNRLGIMKNYIKIVQMRLGEEDSVLGELKIVSEEIDRVSHIADQLSDFSRPAIGESAPVSLEHLFEGLLRVLDISILQPKKIKAHLSLDPTVSEIVTDEEALKQVFINLVKNAAEAMPHGGNIYVRTRRVEAGGEVGMGDKGPYALEITLTDDGPGIPQHIKVRLFEPYNTTKGADHSGLGLSIVYNIIEELRGVITCESVEGKGTTFRILLPLA
jgi:signal transduction histidine kinase/HD-like signal output (HDOD) protein